MSHSPLETVARNHGAVMVERNGRWLPAHFGSAAAEETVCLHGVGMSDRFDRSTLEVVGTPSDVERALIALGELAWYSFLTADRAVARTEDPAACIAALARALESAAGEPELAPLVAALKGNAGAQLTRSRA